MSGLVVNPQRHVLSCRGSDILLTRLRHRCSSLNADLFHVNIIPNAAAVVEQTSKLPNS